MKKIQGLICCFFLMNCSTFNLKNYTNQKICDITIFENSQKLPYESIVLKNKTLCTNILHPIEFDSLVFKAKLFALSAGGNAIKIISKRPQNNFLNKMTFKLKFEVIKLKDNVIPYKNNEFVLKDFVKLKIYRYDYKSLRKFYLKTCDTVIEVKNRFRKEIVIKQPKDCKIWAEMGSNKTKKIDIHLQKGKSYFVKCRTIPKLLTVIPNIELMDSIRGSKEYDFFE